MKRTVSMIFGGILGVAMLASPATAGPVAPLAVTAQPDKAVAAPVVEIQWKEGHEWRRPKGEWRGHRGHWQGERRHHGPRYGHAPRYGGPRYGGPRYGYGPRYGHSRYNRGYRGYRPYGSGIYLQFGSPYYYGPGYYAPRRVYRSYGSAHVRWCQSRYRTYRAWDNTYVPKRGYRAQCRSPYRY